MDVWLKIFLPIFMLAYFGLAFFWRSYLVWKKTGVNPYRLGNTDNAHDFIGRVFRLTMLGCLGLVMIYSFLPGLYPYLLPIAWLEHPFSRWLGLSLLISSLAWILIAQSHLGESWRIGIDATGRTPLVRSGLFRFSRNPIFLGMRVTLLGFFLLLPNTLTLLLFVLGEVLMQIQVRLEEDYLARTHGEAYGEYCRQVRRWI